MLSMVRGNPARGSWLVIATAITSSRALIEHVVTQDEHGSLARLLVAPDRVQIGPTNLAPQYSGHDSSASANPSSASCFSSSGFSFAASRARRVRAHSMELVREGRFDCLTAIPKLLPDDEVVDLLEQAGVQGEGDFGLRHGGMMIYHTIWRRRFLYRQGKHE